MVPPAPDAWAFGAIAPIRTESLRQARSPLPGNGIPGAEKKAPIRRPNQRSTVSETKCSHPPIAGLCATFRKFPQLHECAVDLRGLELRARHAVPIETVSGRSNEANVPSGAWAQRFGSRSLHNWNLNGRRGCKESCPCRTRFPGPHAAYRANRPICRSPRPSTPAGLHPASSAATTSDRVGDDVRLSQTALRRRDSHIRWTGALPPENSLRQKRYRRYKNDC
jgi:hypothetical protein